MIPLPSSFITYSRIPSASPSTSVGLCYLLDEVIQTSVHVGSEPIAMPLLGEDCHVAHLLLSSCMEKMASEFLEFQKKYSLFLFTSDHKDHFLLPT